MSAQHGKKSSASVFDDLISISKEEKMSKSKTKSKSRIQHLFNQKKNNILNVYCTAGYPKLGSTLEVLKALQKNGADMIELGMPYSDPLADGPVIQASGSTAIVNGMTIKVLFEQLKDMRDQNSLSFIGDIPVILMGYMNPVLQYGFEKFCADAAAVGVDGLILPDLPEYEFETQYGELVKKYGLDFIFLVTPETSEQRIRKLDELSTGFLYAVSSSSTTGKDKNMNDVTNYLQRLKGMQLKNPVLVGFGIKDRQTFKSACVHANGAIIGTAYIRALQNADDVYEQTRNFLKNIK
jgi:tryptophan synthase alpha chain